MADRRDKFTYTDPRQIKIGGRKDDAAALRALRELIEREGLDTAKVLALVRAHLDALRR
jgi:hypothetical protein